MNQKSIYKAFFTEAHRAKVEEFKTHLGRLGYSEKTLHMLPSCAAEFLAKLEEKGIYHLGEIEPVHIQEHYEYLTERPHQRRPGGLSDSMINHHLYAIRLFLNYQEQLGRIRENPISGLDFPRPSKGARDILTPREVKQLYQVTRTFKERAILGIFYGCGLRRSEGVALNIKDISFKNNLLHVREGKGKKRRVVPFNEQVKEDFKNYLYRERWARENIAAFICNQAGNRTSGNRFNKILKTLLSRAREEYPGFADSREISLHGLRHSIATHLLDNGLPVEQVRDFLGHAHLEATQIYTRISRRKLWNL